MPISPPERPVLSLPLHQRPEIRRLLSIALLAEVGYAVLNLSAMPIYLAFDRGFGAGAIGLVLTAFLLSEALLKGPMGHLADGIGRKRLIVIGPTLSVVTAVATLFVPHNAGFAEIAAIVLLRGLDGLGAAMVWPALFALTSESVEGGERQHAMSMLNTCYLAGIALAMPIGGLVNDSFGSWFVRGTGPHSPSLYLASLVFAAVALWAQSRLVSDFQRRKAERADSGRTTKEEWTLLFQSVRRIPRYLVLAMVTFVGVGFPVAIIKLFARQQFDMSETRFGLLVLPSVGALAIFSVPMARFGQQIGTRRALQCGLGLCAFGMCLIAAGALTPVLRTALVLALGAVPVGVGFLLAIPAWYASVAELDPARRASNIGAVMTAQGLGAIVGAPLGGLAYQQLQVFGDTFGRYSPFLGCAGCLVVAWALSFKLLN